MPHKIFFASEAEASLAEIYDYVASLGGERRAGGFIARLEADCAGFSVISKRGQTHDAIRPGLRTIGFERRITVVFAVDDETVEFLQFLYAGRDVEAALARFE